MKLSKNYGEVKKMKIDEEDYLTQIIFIKYKEENMKVLFGIKDTVK